MKTCSVKGCNGKHLAKGLCQAHYHEQHRANNRAACCAKSKKWREANHEQALAATAAWRAANPEWETEYRQANPQQAIAKTTRYAKRHPDRVNARNVKRRATKLNATPAWANPIAIGEYYAFATLKSKITGERWEVDHIVPLQNPLVCGLHTDYNLRVITRVDNIKKKNYWWPDMPQGESP